MPLDLYNYDGDLLTLKDYDGDVYTLYFDHEDETPVQTMVDPATPSGAQPMGASSAYTLALSEEFNSAMEVLNPVTGHVKFRAGGYPWATWYPDWPRFNVQNPGGNHTNTNQGTYYSTNKVSVHSGSLILDCDQESTGELPYTGGMITSKDMFEPTSGWFEARLKINGPRNSRHWPAWWLVDADYNQWQREGDVWELFGTMNDYLTNVYYPSPTSPDIHHNAFSDFANYHVYGMHWTPEEITFYRDGVETYSTGGVTGPMYLILNNGCEWPEGAAAPTGTMPTIEVDYVRAWA